VRAAHVLPIERLPDVERDHLGLAVELAREDVDRRAGLEVVQQHARRPVVDAVPHDVATRSQPCGVESSIGEVALASEVAPLALAPQRGNQGLGRGAFRGRLLRAGRDPLLVRRPLASQRGGVAVGRDAGDLRGELQHARELPANVEARQRGREPEDVALALGAAGIRAAVVDAVAGLAIDQEGRASLLLAAQQARGKPNLRPVAVLHAKPIEQGRHPKAPADILRVEPPHGTPPDLARGA